MVLIVLHYIKFMEDNHESLPYPHDGNGRPAGERSAGRGSDCDDELNGVKVVAGRGHGRRPLVVHFVDVLVQERAVKQSGR